MLHFGGFLYWCELCLGNTCSKKYCGLFLHLSIEILIGNIYFITKTVLFCKSLKYHTFTIL